MATPVLESTATNTATSTSSVTVTKPTGTASGDVLIGIFLSAINDVSHNTPSGWSALLNEDGGGDGEFAIFYKTAGGSEPANYTFTASGSTDFLAACILRISGAADSAPVASDSAYDSNGGTSFSEAVSMTPNGEDCLLLHVTGAVDIATTVVMTTSSQDTTPTQSWSEQLDFGVTDSISNAIAISVSTVAYSGSSEFTNMTATFSECDRGSFGAVVAISEQVDGNGTNALHVVTPVEFAEASVEVGTSGSNALHATTPDEFVPKGAFTNTGVSPTNEAKNAISPTNDTKNLISPTNDTKNAVTVNNESK